MGPQGILCQATFQLGVLQHVLQLEVFLPQMQNLPLSLVELQDVPVSPFLQPGEDPGDGSRTL